MIPLAELRLLAIDCQATGANPERNQLLEVGWGVVEPPGCGSEVEAVSCLVKPSDLDDIPDRVLRITGIRQRDLADAFSTAGVWRRLTRTAASLNGRSKRTPCPTVVHFSRFEIPYLRLLHQLHGRQRAFPFQIACTHEISRRLLPGLPRRGLRAVAGYFGHSVPEERRSGHHVRATGFVWQALLSLLDQQGVRRWDQLLEWLDQTAPSVRGGAEYPMSRALRLSIPSHPGVYRMLRGNGDVLYVGKAACLKKRVNSYFQGRKRHAGHILEMLSQARRIEVTRTGSALEAALMESDLIKELSPPYNVSLRPGIRRLHFLSLDLAQSARECCGDYPVGPFPTSEPLPAPSQLSRWLQAADRRADFREAQDYFHRGGIEEDAFHAGLLEFRQRHLKGTPGPTPRWLLRLGTKLWRERLDVSAPESQRDDAAGVENAATEEKGADEPSWSPDRIANLLEALLMRASFSLRRARWLCLLGESSLSWRSCGDRRPYLVLDSGAIARRGRLRNGQPPPTPPGHAKTRLQRQRQMNLESYDRLVVLTRELRRLVSEGRSPLLRLSPGLTLDQERLGRLLNWV